MKGIVLAGGLGTRLSPLTNITNKHLLPVWNKPMIFYPLEMLANAGILDVIIVVGGKSTGEIVRLVGDGKQFGFKNVYYVFQKGEGGIAEALALTESYVDGDRMCVVLGDNVIEMNIKDCLNDWKNADTRCHLILTRVSNPEEFGCPIFNNGSDKIIQVVEKPKEVNTPYIVSGIYFYGNAVFNVIRKICKSNRGELEISDVNNWYARLNEENPNGLSLSHSYLSGWWGDAGSSIEGLYEVSMKVKETGANKL